ncbi:TIR domain-containing protein [Barnesiella intestinihominis]|uniref:TIR domain-containing protein n=1 Tax=Barnesiella intestinihominis TaxID=487174 RepID=UPI0026760743|nr:TIR domain-containing protein [Barnesiella intestinihominis]
MAKAHIFISYAHEDKEWVLEGPGNIHLIPRIRRHTSPDAEIWFDEGLVIGEKWDEEIHNHIVQSHIAILLISESFVSSDYIVNKELVWIKEQVEKNDMKIVPLLIGNITEKSKRIIDWIYQRQIHPSETQPLCNYLNDKAQWDHMITSILNIIDAKIDQVLETLLLNENTRQAGYSIKPTVTPDSKTVTGNIENRDTKITDKTTAAHPTGVNPALYQEAIRLYRNHKYKEASDILLKLAAANNTEAQNLLCDILCNKVKGYQLWPGILETFLPYAEENLAFAQTIVGKVYYRGKLNKRNYEKAFDWFSKAAESGNSYAQYLLGNMYENGTFVEQNYDTALSYYKNSAAQNNIMAIGEMAYMKDNGYGMPMNKEEAEKIYLQLAEERDDEWSMIKLAYIEMDRGNSEERLKWIQKALEKEYIDAYVDLGIFYQSDEKYKDLEKAQQSYYQAAQLGNPEGMNGLAMIYYDMPDNKGDEQAFRWFSKSADLGDSLGLYYLAVMYENGFGTNVDKQKAWDLYLASADQKFSPAYRKIAQLIEEGEAPASFTGRELEYYIKAAERNDIDAIHDVIRFLENDPDRQKELFSWCQRGAQLNDGKCICKLGKLYFYGMGTEMDEFKAMNCFRKAETMEIPEAYYFLGLAYYEAKGVVSPNIQKAEEYFRKAAEAGYSEAIKAIAELYMQSGQENGYEKAIEYLKTIAEGEHADIAYEGLMRIAVEQMNAQDYDDPQNSELYQKALRFETSGKEAGMTESLSKAFLDRGINLYNIEKYESAIAPLLLAAQMGESEAATHLGDLYFYGHGVDTDYEQSYYWFAKAAQSNNAYAQYSIAFMYIKGQFVEKDDTQVIKWMKLAAENGYTEAQKNMGEYYYYGSFGCRRDMKEAIKWYEMGAKSNEPTCVFTLGLIYEEGDGVQKNILKAADWYQKGAQAGIPSCLYNLGKLIINKEISGEEEKGFNLIQQAAESGYSFAQNYMGRAYRFGWYVNANPVRATNWFTKAAEQNMPDAMCNLGDMYSYEDGLTIDYEKAFYWYEKAAETKHSRALTELGDMYYAGKGVRQDYQKAMEYYQKACDEGYPYAFYSLGFMYWKGQGTLPDKEKAQEYLSQAAAMGNESAFQLLNRMDHESEEEKDIDPFARQAYLEAQQALADKETEKYINLLSQSANLGYVQALNDLGDLYFNGELAPKHMGKAYEYFLKASQNGSGYGSYSCGFILMKGSSDIPRDIEKGLSMFRLAVDQNYKAATRDLARYYYSLETEEDNRKALDYYLQYIEYNPKDTDTLLHIGLIYESGLGVPLNIDLARRYYERAAEQDETGMAYNFLGGTYMNDEETESNERKAVHYFQKAIELGNTNAMFRISYYLHNGKGGLQVDIPREIELLTEASKRGNHQATYRLGLLFEDNESGMAQNLELSVKYFQLAADNGILAAINKMGELYLFGEVIPANLTKAISCFTAASEQGYGKASYWLGRLHTDGIGQLEKDTQKAMNYYCKAIEQGYEEAREWMEQLQKNLVDETITDIEIPQDKSDEELYKEAKNALEKAQFKTAYAYFSYLTQRNHAESFNELGDMYFYGRGMAINQAKALELYKKAAALDSVYGFFNVGFLYWNGPEEIQDPEQALQYLKKAAQMGYTYALSFIGDIYRTGPEKLIDYAEAKRYYQKGVDVNEINAIKGMALLYLLGQGVTQNNAMGAFYLKKAADKGNAWAMYHLGRLYYYGEGIPRNPKLALDYLQMAYDANYPDACSLLGLLYERGEGTAPNIELANKLYIRGHELGDNQSMWYLACNYLDGNGLPKDYKRAEKLFIQAIERGNEPARIDLARMIFHGLGTIQDPQKAYGIIKPCLEQGYGRAYMLMGEVYENGLGVEKDYKQAKELYRKALDLGYNFAQEALDRLDKFC